MPQFFNPALGESRELSSKALKEETLSRLRAENTIILQHLEYFSAQKTESKGDLSGPWRRQASKATATKRNHDPLIF